MIDYKTYDKIINYLDKNELDKLKLYLNNEKEKYYLSEARKNLKKFFKVEHTGGFYSYTEDGKFLLCNWVSIYILNNDEILTPYLKNLIVNKMNDINIYPKDYIDNALNLIKKYESGTMLSVNEISTYDKNTSYKCLTHYGHNNIFQIFKSENLKYIKYFLGENVEYKINEVEPVCKATSDKGKALILGVNKNHS